MVALAAINRFRLTPALEGAIAALRRGLGMETACAVVALAIVAWLGTLEPVVSAVGAA